MREQWVVVDEGVGLYVRHWPDGSGPPFLLVHGLASNARMWDGVVARLRQRGYPSAAVDLRGHGPGPKPDTGYDFATITDDLASLIKDEGWDRPVAVGQSWGGNVVVELAWRFPELVRGVVGIDGGAIELSARFPSWEACKQALRVPVDAVHLKPFRLTEFVAKVRQMIGPAPA